MKTRTLPLILAIFALACALPTEAANCSLANHIRSANSNTSVGGCPKGTSHDIITLSEDIRLGAALPSIRGTITIEGNGHTISGDFRHRIFDVQAGRLTLNNLTLSEGRAGGDDHWGAFGGAIRLSGGEVAVNRSRFVNNAATNGGAIALVGSQTRLSIKNSSFINNQASYHGGAIMKAAGEASINSGSFVGNVQINRIQGDGGAIAEHSQQRLDIANSTFSANQARSGGALSIRSAKVTMTHLSFVDNQAFLLDGHAIFLESDERLITLASRHVALRNSVLGGRLPIGKRCYGALDENIGNFIEDGSCAPFLSGKAGLSALTGSPAYHEPLDDSLLINTADPRHCPDFDQLGRSRPQQGGCDIGAIESLSARPATLPPPSCTLADKIIAANTDAEYAGCDAGQGADTISLSRDVVLSEALPAVTSEIIIEGNGHSISGGRQVRIFAVDGGALTLKDMTLRDGWGAAHGGAVLLEKGGKLIAEDLSFVANRAEYGGAIATSGDAAQLTILRGRFMRNQAEEMGLALHIDGGDVDISDSLFSANEVSVSGRATMLEGGAIAMLSGQLSASNSSFHNNRAIHGGAFTFGGGTAALTHLTLVDNVSTFHGGDGIQQRGGSVSLRNSLITGAGNGRSCRGLFAELSGNFSQDGACSPGFRGDARLGELTGSPAHFPLLDGSPAIDAGDRRYCLEMDRLGTRRPQGAGCDVGAIEASAGTTAPLTPLPKVTTADCKLADFILASNSDAPAGGCPAGYRADSIALSGDITLSAPLPTITSAISIDGNGYGISGGGQFRIFDVDGGNLHLRQLTLRDGNAHGEDGGAIRLRNGAVLNGEYLMFIGNRAENGAAVAADESFLNLDESQFHGNRAAKRGAAIFLQGGTYSIHRGSDSGNSAPGEPGAHEPRLPWLFAEAHGNRAWGYAVDFNPS